MAHQIATSWFELKFQKFVDDSHKNSIWQKMVEAIILAGRRSGASPAGGQGGAMPPDFRFCPPDFFFLPPTVYFWEEEVAVFGRKKR